MNTGSASGGHIRLGNVNSEKAVPSLLEEVLTVFGPLQPCFSGQRFERVKRTCANPIALLLVGQGDETIGHACNEVLL